MGKKKKSRRGLTVVKPNVGRRAKYSDNTLVSVILITEQTEDDGIFTVVKNIVEEQTHKKIDLIKIDTEGAEWDILEGAKQIMKNNSIIFQIEFHWDEDWHRRDLLDGTGYKIYDLNFNPLGPNDARPYQGIVSNQDF